jgi:hypothetical protein
MCKHGKDTSTQVKSLEVELAKERLLNKDLSQKLEAAIAVEAPGTKATPRGGSYLEEATQSYVTKPSVAMDDLDSAENFANVANDDDSATADDFANAEAEDFAINDSDNEPEEIMFNTQSPATPSYKNISFVDDDDELYSLE